MLALVVGICLGLGSQLPRLELDLAPESLVAGDEDAQARYLEALGPLQPDGPTLLLLMRGVDPLSLPALRHAHAAARDLGEEPWVARVDALPVTPLALPPPSTRVTLAALDDDVEDIDASEVEDALGRVLATDPDRFPRGLASLGPRLVFGPVASGRVLGPEDRTRLHQGLARAPSLRRRLVDDSAHVVVVAFAMRPDATPEQVIAGADALDAWLAENDAPAGVSRRVAGLPSVRAAMLDSLKRDQGVLPLLALIASALVLWIGLRDRAGVLLPLGAAGMSCAATMGTMAAFGQPVDLLTNVVPPLLITIGLGDAVHLVGRYREERRTRARAEAVRETVRAMRGACLATSLTTAVGFASLLTASSPVLRRFGLVAALGVMGAYAVTLGALPALLPLLPSAAARRSRLEDVSAAIARLASRGASPIVVVAVVLLAVTLGFGSQVPLDASLLEPLDAESLTARNVRWVEEELDGYRLLEVAVASETGHFTSAAGLRELAELEDWAAERALRVDGPASMLRTRWRELGGDQEELADALADDRAEALADFAAATDPARWRSRVSPDGAHARVTLRLADDGERGIAELADAIEARFEGAAVGGEAAVASRGLSRLSTSLVIGLALAVLVTFLVMGAALRSPRLALLGVLPNVLPLALALAYMAARGLPLHATSAIVFTLSIGLAVDGTIHALTRYREELARGASDPVVAAMRGSGRAITLSTATLLAGFGALAFASFAPIRRFAELATVALLSAWICELVVLPALLARFSGRAPARAPAPAPPASTPDADGSGA